MGRKSDQKVGTIPVYRLFFFFLSLYFDFVTCVPSLSFPVLLLLSSIFFHLYWFILYAIIFLNIHIVFFFFFLHYFQMCAIFHFIHFINTLALEIHQTLLLKPSVSFSTLEIFTFSYFLQKRLEIKQSFDLNDIQVTSL